MTAAALDAAPARQRAAWLAPAAVALLAAAVAWWASAPYLVGVFHDDGVYLLLGRALAEGQGFHYLHLPGAPAAVHYPPLYPLLLASLWKLAPAFPENLPLLLGANVLLVGAAAAGLFAFARRQLRWSDEAAALAAMAATLATPTLTLAGALLSETVFLAALWPALLLAEATLRRPSARRAAWCGAAVGALMLLRTHAVALMGAVALLLLLRREWRALAAFAAAALLVQLPWLAWSASHAAALPAPLRGSYGSYAAWFAQGLHDGGPAVLARTVAANLRELWLLFADRVRYGLPGAAGLAALCLAASLVLAGAWRTARRAPATLIFLAAYLGVVLLLAFAPWRYLWGVWPLVVLLALAGAQHLWSLTRGRAARIALVVVLAVPAASSLLVEARAYRLREWERPSREGAARIAPVVEWVRANTTPSDVVLAEAEQMVFLYAGRRAAPPAAFTAREYLSPRSAQEGAAALREMLRAVPAAYVVSFSPDIVGGARLEAARGQLRESGRAGAAAVFRVVR